MSNEMHLDKLLNAEGPMRWKPLLLEENLHEMDLEVVPEGDFSVLNFADKLINCYDAYEKKNIEKALEIIETVEALIVKLQTTFVSDIKDALLHIIHSTKSFLYMNENNEEQCLKILDGMEDFNKLNETNKAAVYAIRSLCLALYSYDGTRTAVDSINMALSKDPNCPWWLFLKGFYLTKLRKIQNPNDTPSLEEREIFEKVNNQMKEPLFMVYLADAYRETAVGSDKRKEIFFWFMSDDSGKIDLKNEINNMCRKSKQYYEKSFELRGQCPLIAFRCAYGLLKLPQAYQNVKLAKDILTKMLPKHKNSGFGNLVKGFYYETFVKNSNMAKQYVDTAVQLHVFSATMIIIKLKYACKENNFSALEHLETMLENFKESPKQALILSQIISYFMFVKLDLASACDYTIRYFKKKRPGNCLEKHNSCFIRTPEPISLIDVVTDEVKHAMNDKTTSPELRYKLTKFIHCMQFAGIIVLKGKAQNLRKQILEGKIVTTFSGFSTEPNTYNRQDNIRRYQPSYRTQFSENGNFNAGPRQPRCQRGRGGNFSPYRPQMTERRGFVGKLGYFDRTQSSTVKEEIRAKSEFDTHRSPSVEYRCGAGKKESTLSRRRNPHDKYREHGVHRRHSSRDKYHHRRTRSPSWCSSDSEYERYKRKQKSGRKRSTSESSSSKYSSEQSFSQTHKRRHRSTSRGKIKSLSKVGRNRRSLSKGTRHCRRLSGVRRHRRSASRERRLLETSSKREKGRSNQRSESSLSASHYTSTSSESFERDMKRSHKSDARDVKVLSRKLQAIQMGESKRYSENNRGEGREKTWKNGRYKVYSSEMEKERCSNKKQKENRKQEVVSSKVEVKRANKKNCADKSYSKSENDSDSIEEK